MVEQALGIWWRFLSENYRYNNLSIFKTFCAAG